MFILSFFKCWGKWQQIVLLHLLPVWVRKHWHLSLMSLNILWLLPGPQTCLLPTKCALKWWGLRNMALSLKVRVSLKFYHVETCVWARNIVKSFLVFTLESKLAEYENYLSLYFCWSTPYRFPNQLLQESENVRGLKKKCRKYHFIFPKLR